MHRHWTVVAWGLVLIAGGCNAGSGVPDEASDPESPAGQFQQPLGGVAVVDLDEVARQIGSGVTLVEAMREERASVGQRLWSLQSRLRQKYAQKKRELEAQPAAGQGKEDARKQQLAELARQLDIELNQASRAAQGELQTREQRLIQQFREEVKPVARQVAAERGLGVVVTKNEAVLLVFDDAHDITAPVVAKMRARQPRAPGEPAPALSSRPAAPATQRR